MKPLFAYGTFRDPAWRKAILGADYPTRPATLSEWMRIAAPSGYLSVAKSQFDVVSGIVIDLDDVGWQVADAWEDVPNYRRVAVTVRTIDEPQVAAEVYVFAGDNAPQLHPNDEDRFAMLPRADVERAITAFAPHMKSIRDRALAASAK
jgi:gamma-glutamylcyclotransferase (GGCT)/AIG2-like uncharacterized protein YtfP